MKIQSLASSVNVLNLPHVRAPIMKLTLMMMIVLAFENIEITTRSHPDAFPSPLRQARKTQTKKLHGSEALQKVKVICTNLVNLNSLL